MAFGHGGVTDGQRGGWPRPGSIVDQHGDATLGERGQVEPAIAIEVAGRPARDTYRLRSRKSAVASSVEHARIGDEVEVAVMGEVSRHSAGVARQQVVDAVAVDVTGSQRVSVGLIRNGTLEDT